jgi:hypothetical protein
MKRRSDNQYTEYMWIEDVRFRVDYDIVAPEPDVGVPGGIVIQYFYPIAGEEPDPMVNYEEVIQRELERDLL